MVDAQSLVVVFHLLVLLVLLALLALLVVVCRFFEEVRTEVVAAQSFLDQVVVVCHHEVPELVEMLMVLFLLFVLEHQKELL